MFANDKNIQVTDQKLYNGEGILLMKSLNRCIVQLVDSPVVIEITNTSMLYHFHPLPCRCNIIVFQWNDQTQMFEGCIHEIETQKKLESTRKFAAEQHVLTNKKRKLKSLAV